MPTERRTALGRALLVVALVVLIGRLALLADAGGAPRERLSGRVELARGVVVEARVSSGTSVVVARVPRGRGLRLRAFHGDFAPVSELARGALVAVNGDYHRVSGALVATPFSSLVVDERPLALGSCMGDAWSLSMDTTGVPRIGKLDLGLVLRGVGPERPLALGLEAGSPVLVERVSPDAVAEPGLAWLPLRRSGDGLRVAGPSGKKPCAPALRLRESEPAHRELAALAAGTALTTALVGNDRGKIALALGTGPRLVVGGRVNPEVLASNDPGWTNRRTRTAVGLSKDALWLVVTPHERKGGVSFADLAAIFVELGADEALNLDGGPSSTLVAGGKVVTHSLADEETPVPNALGVVEEGGVELR